MSTDDPDPRPVIAAKLTERLSGFLGFSNTENILNEHIPEGAPWEATWDAGSLRLKSVQAGAVTEWLKRHPEAE